MPTSSLIYLSLLTVLLVATDRNLATASSAPGKSKNQGSNHVESPSKGSRSLGKSSFRSSCLYDVTVYVDLLGGATGVNFYDQLVFSDSPGSPGGTLTFHNGQTYEGENPTTFQLVDGGNTGHVLLNWNPDTCDTPQKIQLMAQIDDTAFGPTKRITCGGVEMLFKMRVFLQNPMCLVELETRLSAVTEPLQLSSSEEDGSDEACIFQVTQYMDYTFNNGAYFNNLVHVSEYTSSPATECITGGAHEVCHTFQLHQYLNDGDDGAKTEETIRQWKFSENKYLAMLTTNSSSQCVQNHVTMATVGMGGTLQQSNSVRAVTRCDGSEGYEESNVGASYFWWTTVHVLNPSTCNLGKAAAMQGADGAPEEDTTTATAKQPSDVYPKDNDPSAEDIVWVPNHNFNNASIVRLDELVQQQQALAAMAQEKYNHSSCGQEPLPSSQARGFHRGYTKLFGWTLLAACAWCFSQF